MWSCLWCPSVVRLRLAVRLKMSGSSGWLRKHVPPGEYLNGWVQKDFSKSGGFGVVSTGAFGSLISLAGKWFGWKGKNERKVKEVQGLASFRQEVLEASLVSLY